MKNLINLITVLVLSLITTTKAYQRVESRRIPVVNGRDYQAKFSIIHNNNPPQQVWNGNPQHHSSIQEVADKIANGLLSRKLSPNEAEQEEQKRNERENERIRQETRERELNEKRQQLWERLNHERREHARHLTEVALRNALKNRQRQHFQTGAYGQHAQFGLGPYQHHHYLYSQNQGMQKAAPMYQNNQQYPRYLSGNLASSQINYQDHSRQQQSYLRVPANPPAYNNYVAQQHIQHVNQGFMQPQPYQLQPVRQSQPQIHLQKSYQVQPYVNQQQFHQGRANVQQPTNYRQPLQEPQQFQKYQPVQQVNFIREQQMNHNQQPPRQLFQVQQQMNHNQQPPRQLFQVQQQSLMANQQKMNQHYGGYQGFQQQQYNSWPVRQQQPYQSQYYRQVQQQQQPFGQQRVQQGKIQIIPIQNKAV